MRNDIMRPVSIAESRCFSPRTGDGVVSFLPVGIEALILTLMLIVMLAVAGCGGSESPMTCADSVSVPVDTSGLGDSLMTAEANISLSGRVLLSGRGSFFPTYVLVDNTTNGDSRAARVVTTAVACELAWSLIGNLALDFGLNHIVIFTATPEGDAVTEIDVTRTQL